MTNKRTHKESALFLKYAPSYHLFLQVQGEIAGAKQPGNFTRPRHLKKVHSGGGGGGGF